MDEKRVEGNRMRFGAEMVGRRSVLRTAGALGLAAAATGRVGAEEEEENTEPAWPEPDDAYYETLVEDLSGMGLPPAEFVFGDTESATADEFWAEADGVGTVDELDVSDDEVPFSNATRFEITEEPANNWDVQLRTAEWASEPYRSVEAGDVMLGIAFLRAPDSEGEAQFVVENTQSDQWNSVVSDDYQAVSDEWVQYYFPVEFDAAADGSEFEWSAQFHFGFGPQTVDIGGVALLDFGQDVDSDELPSGAASSAGADGEDDGTEAESDESDSEVDEDDESTDDEEEQPDANEETDTESDDETDEGAQDSETDDDTNGADESEQDDADGQDDSTAISDSIPGFGIGATIAGLGAAAGHLLSRTASDDE